MKFQKYEKYKLSEIDWLGEIPDEWEVNRLKDVIKKMETGTSVNAGNSPAIENKYGVLKTSCVYTGEFNYQENKTVLDKEINRLTCPLKANALIVSRMNTPELIGAAGLVRYAPQNIYLPDRLWQIFFSNSEINFINYLTSTNIYRYYIKTICVGTSSTMQSLSQDNFRLFPFSIPSLLTQITISTYLDNKTILIDRKISF